MSRKGENIYKRKDGRWEGRYKKGRTACGRTLYGSCYGKTYRETKEKLEMCKQKTPAESTRRSIKQFETYCDEWLNMNRNKVKESTFVKYNSAFENHIKPYFGGCKPEEITSEMTAEFVDQIIHTKRLSAKTAKDLAVLFKTVLKYAAKGNENMRIIEVAMPKTVQNQIRVLTKEEQQRLVDYLLKDMDHLKFGVLFALMTGLRVGEICALRFGDVDLEKKTVTVRETMQRIRDLDGSGAKTKIILTAPKSNTSARVVPLTNNAFELCRAKVDKASPNAFLLSGSENYMIEPHVLQYRIKKYSAACGIENMHFHVLRHTFATRCVEVGFEIKSLSEVLGHSSPSLTSNKTLPKAQKVPAGTGGDKLCVNIKQFNMTKISLRESG